jgi:ribosome-associated translation inhibitor RaiA
MTTAMRINLQHLNLRSSDRLDRWIEDQILALDEAHRIDEAHVRLECQYEFSPPFTVHIQLVTPGPDIFAESRDHTLRAAFTKALTQLRKAITGRAKKQSLRSKGNSSASGTKMQNTQFV